MRRRNHCNNKMNEHSHLIPISKNACDVYHRQRRYYSYLPSCITITILCICFFLVLTNKHFQGIRSTTTIPIISSSIDHKNKYIHPGFIFFDTQNKPINAHGGGLIFYNNTYYWYGEIKVGKTYLPPSNADWGGTRVDLTGISCYSSTDLLHWRYEGNVLPAVTNDTEHDLYVDKVAERPKVVYNEQTNKFVMWLHIDSMDYKRARSGVATSDRPEGPFTCIQSFRPNNQMARDLTIYVDDDTRAYLFYSSEDNAAIHVSELSDDYLSTKGNYSRIFVGRYMEAPTVFKKDGAYYFIGSGCTAWKPNAARSAVSYKSIFGPWKELGNPARGLDANTTFHSQSTYVLPVVGDSSSERFIFIADIWNEMNLSDSRYVWLLISFEEERPTIHWHDEWSPS